MITFVADCGVATTPQCFSSQAITKLTPLGVSARNAVPPIHFTSHFISPALKVADGERSSRNRV